MAWIQSMGLVAGPPLPVSSGDLGSSAPRMTADTRPRSRPPRARRPRGQNPPGAPVHADDPGPDGADDGPGPGVGDPGARPEPGGPAGAAQRLRDPGGALLGLGRAGGTAPSAGDV